MKSAYLLDFSLCATQWRMDLLVQQMSLCMFCWQSIDILFPSLFFLSFFFLSFFFFFSSHLVFIFVNLFVPLFFLCWTLTFFYYSWTLNFTVGLYFNYLFLSGSLNYVAVHFGVFSVPSATSVQILHSFLFCLVWICDYPVTAKHQ